MYEIAEELERLATDVIGESEELKQYNNGELITPVYPRIAYLWSDSAREDKKSGQIIYAETSKQSEKQSIVSGTDFIITFYRPNCEALDEEQMRILMLHELLHVGVTEEGDFFIRKHDISDFKCIIDKHGTDWADSKERRI